MCIQKFKQNRYYIPHLLDRIQREREERHRLKRVMRGEIPPDPGEPIEDPLIGNVSKFDPMPIDDKSKDNTGWIDKWLI